MKCFFSATIALGLVATPHAVFAQRPDALPTAPAATSANEDPVYKNYEPERRRDGLVFALAGGVSMGHVAGYPTAIKTLDLPGYRSSTPLLAGYVWTLSVGGSISDYVNVSGFFTRHEYATSNWKSHVSGGGLRLDLFPFAKHQTLHDLGVFGAFGLGAAYAKVQKPGEYPDAAGTQSFMGVGAFWEPKLGPVHLGPEWRLDYVPTTYAWGLSTALLLRVSLYTGGNDSPKSAPSSDAAPPGSSSGTSAQ